MLRAGFPCGHKRDLSGFLVTHPVPLPCSETPAEPVSLTAFAVLPPDPTRRRLQHDHDFEACHRASVPDVYASRAMLPSPMQDSLPLAGSAFSVRASNPLGHDEKFLTTFILLSRTYPDASWVHMRRNCYELATAGPAPIASEAPKHIAAFYAIEKEIRGHSAEERRLVRQQKSRPLAMPSRAGCAPNWLSSVRRSSSPRPSATPSRARNA